MPSKKKGSKLKANNRGFATSSIPKKAQDTDQTADEPVAESTPSDLPDPVDQPLEQPVPENATIDDPAKQDHWEDKLIEKLRNINSKRVESYFSQSFEKFYGQTPEDELDIPTVTLPADIEHKILAKVKDMDTSDLLDVEIINAGQLNETEKERLIATLDRIYLMLQKIGFHSEDIERAMLTTKSSRLTDLLDWLCLTLPDERLPVGFIDKAYYEEGMTMTAQAASQTVRAAKDNSPKESEPTPEESATTEVILEEENPADTDTSKDDMKDWILKAAQGYEDDEDDTNINEQHAQARLELIALQKDVSQLNKKKEGGKIESIKKAISNKKQVVQQLETDWDYDKRAAETIFLEKKRLWDEEQRIQLQNQRKMRQQKEQVPVEVPKASTSPVPAVEEEDGGLFGLFAEEPSEASTAEQTSVQLTVIETPPRNTIRWTGVYPKQALNEHCRNIDKQCKQNYTVTTAASNLYSASIKITWKNRDETISMEPGLVLKSKEDAQEYIATFALYKLTDLPLYQKLPSPYKDFWLEWIKRDALEKHESEMEQHRKRFRFILEFIDEASKLDQKNIHKSPLISSSRQQSAESGARGHHANIEALASEFSKRVKSKPYETMKQKRIALPIFSFRDEILDLVQNHQVVIVSGETGCGKSTQVPQYLAEAILQSTSHMGNIVCTQPRRISAISIAQRVSQEMGDKKGAIGSKGSLVGYQIRLESRTSDTNILQFCTTGILLRRLESDGLLEGVTHVVVDEVHERSIESDFLLIILRHLCTMRPDIKIILMSATVDAQKFSSYFGGCPVVQVPGRTFPVEVRFLEDIIEETEYFLEEDSPYAKRLLKTKRDVGTINISGRGGNTHSMRVQWYDDDDEQDDPYNPNDLSSQMDDSNEEEETVYSKRTRLAIRRMDENKINYEVMTTLLEYIAMSANERQTDQTTIPDSGAILIFLPGMPEIRKLHDILASHHIFSDEKKYILIPLHSLISTENQEKVFDLPPAGMRKIILSTNIAETGVTIEDVTIVIDTGMVKEVRMDHKKRITSLQQTFVSRANAKQRRGRAGRVQSGICFHLFTKTRFDTKMAHHQSPEIVRLPLEELCLRIKSCDLGDIHGFLSQALDAPSSKAIDEAVNALQEIQALNCDSTQSLTPLGRHLSNLPVDVHIGKMLLYGAMFQCLDPILTIAASLSFKSPFIRPFGKEDEADKARDGFKKDDSDFATIYSAYLAWRGRMKGDIHPGGYRATRDYCRSHYLSFPNLETIEDMKKQFLGLLVNIGFVQMNKDELAPEVNAYRMKRSERFCQVPDKYNVHSNTIAVVNAAIAAALYPKFAFNARRTKKLIQGPKQEIANIHPSSIVYADRQRLMTNYMVFNTITKSDKVYLWDVASVDDVIIMLFGGNMDILHEQKRVLLDQWIKMKCHAKTAVIFKFLRHHLNATLRAKIDRPHLEMSDLHPGIMELTTLVLQMRSQSNLGN